MTGGQIAENTLKFLGEWLSSSTQILFSPTKCQAERERSAAASLGFAAASIVTAFTIFVLDNADWDLEKNLPYQLLTIVLWCIFAGLVAALLKLLRGAEQPLVNIVIGIRLTAVFYLLQMVVATVVNLAFGKSAPLFLLTFIATGALLYVVYVPVVLGSLNGLRPIAAIAFFVLIVPVAATRAYLDFRMSGGDEFRAPPALVAMPPPAMVVRMPPALAPPPLAPPPAAPQPLLVFFDPAQAGLEPSAASLIDRAAELARARPASRLVLTGHVDTTFAAADAVGVSQHWADLVKNQLVARGIAADAISTKPRGRDEPMVPTADGVREPRNNRVDIVLEP